MSPVNLTSLAKGSLFTLQSENGEHQSVIDYILVPNLFINRIISSFTHEWTIDNLSDHVPVAMAFDCAVAPPAHVDPVQGFPQMSGIFLGINVTNQIYISVLRSH